MGAQNPTGQTVLLKKVFLHKLNFFIFLRSLPGGLECRCCLPPALLLPPHSPPPDLTCRHFPLLLSFAIAVVVVRRHHCCRPPSPLSLSAAVVIHRCHLLPPQPSLPLRVSAVSRHPLLSIPFVVCRPISHAVVV
jgi:hypothetical protein